jgi:hypothetical protein
MPGSTHHHGSSSGKRRRRRSLLDRLLGRNRHRSHSSSFPGINLPEGHHPGKKIRQADPGAEPPAEINIESTIPPADKPTPGPERTEIPAPEPVRDRSSSRKPSLSERINLYFKRRALKREERLKQRMKDKMRRKHQREYRKQEQGRPLASRLVTTSTEPETKKIPLFSQRSEFFRSLTIIVNSMSVFIASYVLVYLFYWLTSMLVASWYGLDSTLYYYDLKFNDHSTLWSRFNILLVTGIPPFFCLALGLFLHRVVFKNQKITGLRKLAVLWTSFHLINHFFGALPSGIVTSEGFGYVAAWMYMNTAFKFMFSLISLFVLVLFGYYSAKAILETSDSLHRIKPENRTAFMLAQILIPWFAGTAIMLLVRLPEAFNYPYETLMFFTMAFMVIPPFFNPKVKPKLNLLKIKKRRNIDLSYLTIMILLLVFLRVMLGIGLHFLIRIDISITPAIG